MNASLFIATRPRFTLAIGLFHRGFKYKIHPSHTRNGTWPSSPKGSPTLTNAAPALRRHDPRHRAAGAQRRRQLTHRAAGEELAGGGGGAV